MSEKMKILGTWFNALEQLEKNINQILFHMEKMYINH